MSSFVQVVISQNELKLLGSVEKRNHLKLIAEIEHLKLFRENMVELKWNGSII